MKLPTLREDKANHFIYGGVIFLVTCALVGMFLPMPYCGGVGIAAAAGLGLVKELCDYVQNQKAREEGKPLPHGVDEWDAFATALGAVFLFLAFLVIEAVHGNG